MWEDDANKRGGRWLISLDKKQRGHDLDNFWMEIVSCIHSGDALFCGRKALAEN